MGRLARSLLCLSTLALVHCGGKGGAGGPNMPTRYTITFAPQIGGQPARCGQSYSGVGSDKAQAQLQDLRLFVHGVSLLKSSGEAVPLALDEDGTWQHENVALLDFADGTGKCDSLSPEVNAVVVGTVPPDRYQGLRFTIGVPEELDHQNAAEAAKPLQSSAMTWGWTLGYRYVKLELVGGPDNVFVPIHLGALGCTGSGSKGDIACKWPSLATVTLPDFVPGASQVAIDLGGWLATSLVGQKPPMGEYPGCTGGVGQKGCVGPYAALGLTFESSDPGPAQVVFHVAP